MMRCKRISVVMASLLCAGFMCANVFAQNIPKYHDIPAYQQKDFFETERVTVSGIKVKENSSGQITDLNTPVKFEIFNSTMQETEYTVMSENGELPALNLVKNHNYIIFAKDSKYDMENVYIWIRDGVPVNIKEIGDINNPTYDYPEVKSLELKKRASEVTDPDDDKRVMINLPVRCGEASLFNVPIKLVSAYDTKEITSGNRGRIQITLMEDTPYIVLAGNDTYGIQTFPLVVKDKSEYGAGKYTYDFSSCARVEEIKLVKKDKVNENNTTVTSLSGEMTVSGMNFKDFLLVTEKLDVNLEETMSGKDYEVYSTLLVNPHRWEIGKFPAGNFEFSFKENAGKKVVGIYLLKENDLLEEVEFTREGGRAEFTLDSISIYPLVVELEENYPKTPENVQAVLSGGHDDVKVSWDASEGADGYLVSYKKSTSKTWSKEVSVKGTSYTKKDLTDNITYNFKVIPYMVIDGEKSYDEAQTVIVDVDTKKSVKAPSSVSGYLSGGYNDVKVSWSKSSNATGYFVYMKADGEELYTCLGNTTKRSYAVKDLADGTKYTFRIVPYYKKNGEKVEGYYGKTKTVYTLKKLDALTVEKYSSKKVRVRWTNISGETGYQISRSTKEDGTNIVSTYATTSGKSKTLTVTKNKVYYYKVRAYKTVNGKKIYGPWSDVTEFVLN